MESEEKKQGTRLDLLLGILSYLNILVLIPLFKKNKSAFAGHHANQGLVLFLLEFCTSVVLVILGLILKFAVPALFVAVGVIGGVLGVFFLLCRVVGIFHVLRHEEKKIPIFGDIKVEYTTGKED